MEIFHPVFKQRITQHFFFGDIAGGSWNPYIGHQDVKIAPMVADVENRPVRWHIFFPDDGNFNACNPQAATERPFDDGERTAVF